MRKFLAIASFKMAKSLRNTQNIQRIIVDEMDENVYNDDETV